MTETEMKLALLRYNTLSKEKADAAYMWGTLVKVCAMSLSGRCAWMRWRR